MFLPPFIENMEKGHKREKRHDVGRISTKESHGVARLSLTGPGHTHSAVHTEPQYRNILKLAEPLHEENISPTAVAWTDAQTKPSQEQSSINRHDGSRISHRTTL